MLKANPKICVKINNFLFFYDLCVFSSYFITWRISCQWCKRALFTVNGSNHCLPFAKNNFWKHADIKLILKSVDTSQLLHKKSGYFFSGNLLKMHEKDEHCVMSMSVIVPIWGKLGLRHVARWSPQHGCRRRSGALAGTWHDKPTSMGS